MKLELIRYKFTTGYTVGKLFINDEYFCETLEDTFRIKKVKHETCIPPGTYEIEVSYSPTFKRELPLLKDVPDFLGIRIHRGNTNKDTSGCILVGKEEKDGFLYNSTPYEEKLVDMLKNSNDNKIIVI